MAKYSRLKVLTEMINVGLVPVFYHPDPEITENVIKACLDGGVRCFEFTNRGDRAYQVFSEVATRLNIDSRLILGTGTVKESSTAALYLQLGANFIVGPNFDPDTARLCNIHKVAYSPGCATVNEITEAQAFGVEICKVFPGSTAGGPKFIKTIRGPMPSTLLMPTGGVEATQENVSAWISAGAVCVGIGSSLFKKEIIVNKNYSAITEMVASIIKWIKDARGGKDPIF